MNKHKFEQLAIDQAKMSTCCARKVGAILVHNDSEVVIAHGFNYSPDCMCNDENLPTGPCRSIPIHAEAACLANIHKQAFLQRKELTNHHDYTLFITQPPCNACLSLIRQYSDELAIHIDVHICEEFMKFDDSKNALHLIPPEWIDLDGQILTYGAHKYKPNNWRKGDRDRYISALMRHFLAWWQGEELDSETGLPHLAHVRTNAGFLMTLDMEKKSNDCSD